MQAVYTLYQTSMIDFVNNPTKVEWKYVTAYCNKVDALNARKQLMSENEDIYVTIR